MEPTENQPHLPNEPQIILTDQAQYFLQKTGQWAYFLGIIGFVITGFIVIGALFVGTIMSTAAKINPMMPYASYMGTALTVVYLLMAIFYFFFSLYVYQFGSHIKNGITYSNTAEVTVALSKLKSFFKLWGITTIVIIVLYILFFIGMIVVGMNAASTLPNGSTL